MTTLITTDCVLKFCWARKVWHKIMFCQTPVNGTGIMSVITVCLSTPWPCIDEQVSHLWGTSFPFTAAVEGYRLGYQSWISTWLCLSLKWQESLRFVCLNNVVWKLIEVLHCRHSLDACLMVYFFVFVIVQGWSTVCHCSFVLLFSSIRVSMLATYWVMPVLQMQLCLASVWSL